jgi:hypothetical protein
MSDLTHPVDHMDGTPIFTAEEHATRVGGFCVAPWRYNPTGPFKIICSIAGSANIWSVTRLPDATKRFVDLFMPLRRDTMGAIADRHGFLIIAFRAFNELEWGGCAMGFAELAKHPEVDPLEIIAWQAMAKGEL